MTKTDPTRNTAARFIALRRANKRMTRKEIAEHLGISPQRVSAIAKTEGVTLPDPRKRKWKKSQ